MRRRGRLAAWMLGAHGIALVGCGPSSPPAEKKPAPTAISPAPTTPTAVAGTPAAPSVPAPRVAARLFVDTSGSIRGFFGKGHAAAKSEGAGHALTDVHAAIDEALGEAGLGRAEKCTVGARVACPGAPQTPAQLGDGRYYVEETSRLDEVFARRPPPARIDPDAPPAPDRLDDARVTLLLTDGMEAAGAGTPSQPGEPACAHGADPTCITALLRARIAEGYGVWLVGVLLPFAGPHYAERALLPADLERARAHVADLKFDPKNLGVAFSVADKGGLKLDKEGHASFSYEGYKPLLTFVLSRDAKAGRDVAHRIATKLAAAPIQPGRMKGQDTVADLELAPLDATRLAVTAVERPADAEQLRAGVAKPALVEFKLEATAPFDGGVSAKLWCGGRGHGFLDARFGALTQGTLPPFLVERPLLVPAPTTPPGTLLAPSLVEAGRVRFGLSCAPLAKGQAKFQLTLATDLQLDETQLARQWWSTGPGGWSSVDNYTMPERLYGLETLVLPLLRDRAQRRSEWSQVVVHVTRE